MTVVERATEFLRPWIMSGVPPEVIAQAMADAGLLRAVIADEEDYE